MTTVNTERALAEYQRRIGTLYSELVLRDVALAEVEEQLAEAKQELATLRELQADNPAAARPLAEP